MDESDLLQNHQARVKQQTAAYKKIKVLGEGSMGKAYLVESNIDHQLYVMKRINIGHLSPEQKQLAMRQAQLHSLVHHPNIIAFKQIYHTTGDKLCIIMEYAQNGDLDQFIQQQNGKLLNEEIVLYYFTQICLGLKEIHSKKIIHRDLKGANIFLSKNNTVKIGDFGISKVIDQTVQASKSFVGTPYYLSPEMVQGKPYSTKADVWALGVILYNLCSQKLPFEANSLPLLALRILKGSYPPLTGPYSKQMKSLISSMLQTDAKKRPNVTEILMKPLLTKFIPKQEAEKLEQLRQKPRITKTSTVANLASPTITGQSIKSVKPVQKSNKVKLSQQQKKIKQKQLKDEKKKKRDEQFKQMKEDIRKKRMQAQKQKVSSAGFITDQAPNNASKQLQKKLTQLPKSPSKVKSQEQTKPFVEKPWKTVKNKGQIKKDVEVEILLPSTKPKQHKKQQPIVPIDFKIQIKQYGKKPVSMGDISQDLTKLSPQNINKIKSEEEHSQQQDSYENQEGQIEQIQQQYQETQESHQGGKTDFQSMMNQLKHAQNTVNGLKNYNSKQIQLYEESQNFDDQSQKDQQHSQKKNSARMPEMNTMQQHSWNAINGSDNLQQCRQILQEGLGQQRFMKAYHILNQHLDQSQRKKMRGEQLQGYTFNRQVLRQKLDFLTDKQFHDYVILMYTVIVIQIEQMRKNLDD